MYNKSIIALTIVGQYGKIFSSRASVLALATLGPILPSLELNIFPYCPPAHAIIYMYGLMASCSQRLRSPVWDHFEKITGKKVKCKHCEAVLAYHGGTSLMNNHLLSHHQDLCQINELFEYLFV